MAGVGLEASVGRPQSAPGLFHGGNSARNVAMQSSPSSSTATATTAVPQWYAEPQAWHWYYYPPPSPQRPQTSIPGSLIAGTASPAATDAMLASLCVSVKALQSQFTAFREGMGDLQSDVKDALAQIHAMRTAQSETDRAIVELEGVIGVHTRPGRGGGVTAPAIEALLAHQSVSDPTLPVPISAALEKDYVDASTQASPSPSTIEPLCSLLHSHGHSLGLVPVDWSVDPATHGRYAGNPVRPTAFTPEYLAQFLRDAHLPSTPVTTTDSQTPQSDLSAYPGDNSENQRISSTLLPTASDTSVFPSSGGTTTTMEIASSPISELTELSLATRDAVSLTVPPGMGSLSSLSPLTSSLTSPVGSNSENAQMTSDAEGDTTLVAGWQKTPLSRHSTPIVADSSGLTSGLPTPPSDTASGDREPWVVSRSTREQGAATDPKMVSRPHIAVNFPVIPTPPSLTPEPSATPPLFPLIPAGQNSLTGDASGRAEACNVMDEYTISPEGTVVAVGCEGDTEKDALIKGARPTPGTKHTGVATSIFTTPVITLANESPSNEDSSQAPQVTVNVPELRTTRPPTDQPNIPPPTHEPSGPDLVPSYRDGYNIPLSSPPCHPHLSPPPSTAPSRYATPSDSMSVRPTADEDEVWRALVLGGDAEGEGLGSGVSSPLSDLPMMFSHEPSRAGSASVEGAKETLSVDPAVLHCPPAPAPAPALAATMAAARGSEVLSTSSDEAMQRNKEVYTHPIDPSDSSSKPSANTNVNAQLSTHGESHTNGRWSESSQPPSRSQVPTVIPPAPAPASISASPFTVRAASRLGGPSASLDELAMLARREPLKIWLRVPGGLRGMKRRWIEDSEGSDGPDTSARASGRSTRNPFGVRDVVDLTSSEMTANVPASRKRTRKESERGEYARLHYQKSKRPPRSSARYHVRNGEIVAIPRAPDPGPTSSASQLGEERSLTRVRHYKDHAHPGTKTPQSSPSREAGRSTFSPTKEEKWNAISQSAGAWPELPSLFSQWDVQFIQCDNCDKWYHYGCVAIKSGDPRLEPSALFICTTCHIQSARRLTLRNQEDACARPDCPEPQLSTDTELYFVEKLVGRKKIDGYMHMWLAKWEGYPMTQATWIPKENVVGDGTRMINVFLEDAIEQGADLSKEVVLLQEALDAGWDSETC